MAIKGNPEAVRKMRKEIADTIRDLENMSRGISSGLQTTGEGWKDAKATEFNTSMLAVANAVKSPIDELKDALPKLDKLAQLMDDYNQINLRN